MKKILGIIASIIVVILIGGGIGYLYCLSVIYPGVQYMKYQEAKTISTEKTRSALLEQKAVNDRWEALEKEMKVQIPLYAAIPKTFVYVGKRNGGYSFYKDDLGLYLVWKEDPSAQSVHILYLGNEK